MAPACISRARLQATVALAGGLVFLWRFGGRIGVAVAGVAATFALLAWLAPAAYAPVQRALDFAVRMLVAGFSWLMLGLVYFGLFTPLRVLAVLAGRDPLRLKLDRKALTHLRPLPPAPTGRFDRQF